MISRRNFFKLASGVLVAAGAGELLVPEPEPDWSQYDAVFERVEDGKIYVVHDDREASGWLLIGRPYREPMLQSGGAIPITARSIIRGEWRILA